jgi:hypothetical protein
MRAGRAIRLAKGGRSINLRISGDTRDANDPINSRDGPRQTPVMLPSIQENMMGKKWNKD